MAWVKTLEEAYPSGCEARDRATERNLHRCHRVWLKGAPYLDCKYKSSGFKGVVLEDIEVPEKGIVGLKSEFITKTPPTLPGSLRVLLFGLLGPHSLRPMLLLIRK